MRVGKEATLWAAGDGAAVPWDDRGNAKVSPPTAQFAFRQGELLGKNIFRVLSGGEPRPFRYRYLGQLATIGERQAVAEIMGFHFKGFIAWWMWRTIYLAKLPGIVRKLRVMIDWTFDLVFVQGTPCRGFFYVRRGSLTLSTTGLPDRPVAAGSVIDQSELDSSNLWEASATAAEGTDLVVFRGRLLEYLRKELRIIKRQ